MKERWKSIPSLLKKWLQDQEESQEKGSSRERALRREPIDETFEVQSGMGHSILYGKFKVGNQTIQVSHSQWEGDSYPMSLVQRKEILRMTVVERLKKRGVSAPLS